MPTLPSPGSVIVITAVTKVLDHTVVNNHAGGSSVALLSRPPSLARSTVATGGTLIGIILSHGIGSDTLSAPLCAPLWAKVMPSTGATLTVPTPTGCPVVNPA